MPDRLTSEKLFLEHLGWIDRVASMACSRAGMWGAEAEDFANWIRLKLMEDDYAAIQKFRGDATPKTFLATVVIRQLQEYRRQRGGRWRRSAAAERLGPPAADLEALVYREGYTLEQAGQKLRTSGRTTLSDAALARLLEQLPRRSPLRPVHMPGDAALDTAEGRLRADERIAAEEVVAERERVMGALRRAMDRLDPDDRMIVRMHFADGMTLPAVARVLKLEQKPLYRRIEKLRAELQASLEGDGVRGEDVHSVLEEEIILEYLLPSSAIEAPWTQEDGSLQTAPFPAASRLGGTASRMPNEVGEHWTLPEAKRRVAELAGGLLTSSQVAEVLGISTSVVQQRTEARELLAVQLPHRGLGFPASQLRLDGRVRSNVGVVARAGSHIDPWVLLSILVDDVEDGAGGTLLERLDESAVVADVLSRLVTYGKHVAS
jgi:RNA polymerase sigma factor (sigma-70 family)